MNFDVEASFKDETSSWRSARTRLNVGVIYKDETLSWGTSRTGARGDVDVSTWGREPHEDVRTRGRRIYKDETSS